MRLTALFLILALPVMADPAAEIVILGEVHDNPDAHLGQAGALRALRPTAVVFGADAARFGLDAALPEDQQEKRMQLQFEAHCGAMPLEMMAGMVAVQRYRDAVFARAALEALETYGPPVAVIAGNGHARTDWGIPAVIAKAAPDVTTHAIGFVENDFGMPFDDTRIVPPAERDDPCATLTSN